MNSSSPILPGYFSFGSLVLAIMALPFSSTVCHAALAAYLVCWIAEGRWNEKLESLKRNIILQVLVVFFLIQLTGVFYSQDQTSAWFEIEKKIFLFLVPLAMGTSTQRLTADQVRILLFAFVATCFLACVYCLGNAFLETLLFKDGQGVAPANIGYLNSSDLIDVKKEVPTNWLFFSYVGLADSINIHPAYLSLYIAFSIIILFYEVLTVPQMALVKRILLSSLIVFFSLIEVFLSTRIMIFSLIAIFIAIAGFYATRNSLKTVFVIGALIALVVTSLIVNPVSFYRNINELAQSNFNVKEKSLYRTSAEIRASLWWLGWKAYTKANPVIGVGTGDVKESLKGASDEYQITNVLDSYDPHNQYLYVLIANGLLGFVAFSGWLLLPVFLAIRYRDFLYLGLMFLFAALCLTESALQLQKGIAFLSIMYPIMVFERQPHQHGLFHLKFFSARN